jgi:L-iditol 2-dehydrogenase
MKALRIHGPLDAHIDEVALPGIADDQVLVRVQAAGICATDIELYDGRMPYIRQGLTRLPLTPGHEWSGTVERTGKDVTSVKAGDLVVGDISLGCGRRSEKTGTWEPVR